MKPKNPLNLPEITREEQEKLLKSYKEANFLQSPAWGEMNRLIGHQVYTVKIGKTGFMQAIVKEAKRGRYLEVPGGPLIDWGDQNAVKSVINTVSELARATHSAFARIRPQLPANSENLAKLASCGLKISPMHLHAEHTVILDLSEGEDALLANMRRQTRYEVRRAGKLGITVEKDNSEALFKEFHQIQLETAARQHFVPPDEATLMAERAAFGDAATIYTAKTAEGEPIAYGLIIGYGREAEYFEAASTPLGRSLPGAYALQWQAIRDLKAAGYERYNLWGIAPAGQPHHRYAGVTTFKTGFGGQIVEFVPAHDLIVSPARYLPNLVIETARKKRRHL